MKNVLLVCLTACLTFTLTAQKRNFTTDDGLDLVRLGTSLISPNGEVIIYGKSELDWDKNKRKTTYHYVSSDGSETYRFIGEAEATTLQFSPDNKYLSFKRPVDKKQQIFLMRLNGGEAIQLSKHEESIGAYIWSPDASKIYFIANRVETKEEKKEKKDGNDHVVIDEGPNGQRAGKWNHLHSLDVESGKIETLTDQDLIIRGMDISPDGNILAFWARKENRRNQRNLGEVYTLDLSDKSIMQITNNAAPESSLKWSPDGKYISVTAPHDQKWELKNSKIWLIDPQKKSMQLITGNFVGSIRSNYFWSPDSKSIYFSGLQKTVTNIFKLNLSDGVITNLSNKDKGTYSLSGMSTDRSRLIYSYSDHQTPADLYLSETNEFSSQRLTNLNPGFTSSFNLASAKVKTWQSKDGLEIEGIVYYPVNYDKKKKYPLLLHIHGGPAGVFTDSFRFQYHVWAGLGYMQLAPNVRGSSGYSDEFLRGNINDIGGGDYQDLMSGVDILIKEKLVDPDKMAVRGWSYGGILGGTTITKTDRFKAASLGAMVSDWTSEYGIGFNYDVRLWYIGGTFWENPEGYRDKSPLTHVQNVTTPTLILHGANDRTDTEAQSMMFFAALKDLGKEVRYIRFPREPHGFREPRHQRTRDIEEIRWIQKHTLGIEWDPWKREKQKEAGETDKTASSSQE